MHSFDPALWLSVHHAEHQELSGRAVRRKSRRSLVARLRSRVRRVHLRTLKRTRSRGRALALPSRASL